MTDELASHEGVGLIHPSKRPEVTAELNQGIRAAQTGLWTNLGLVLLKLVAGLLGNSYALVADAIESSTDVFSSLIVWRGLEITGKPPDDDYPYGYGKADSIAAAIVALMLIGAAISIMILAVREILTPHHAPAPFTLIVLGGVIICKEILFRKVLAVGTETGSTAVTADAWHHRSDVLTSTAAFIGIAVALWGGAGWESADDWAAAVAAVIIGANGARLIKPAVDDLMDRTPESDLLELIGQAALGVPGVQAIEKVRVRKLGMGYFVDLHVQAEPTMILREAHILSGKVKGAIRTSIPKVNDVLVHMEPYEE
jgi:cation diffusion facilitator family transporter